METKSSNGENQELDHGAHDPETGEVYGEDVTADQLYGGEGPQPDGSVIIPKITMAMIRANPERVKLANPPRPMKMALITGMAGGELLMPPIDDQQRMNDLPLDNHERMTFTALVATIEPWGAVRFDDAGEPDAVFKSDYLFLPTGHNAVVERLRRLGQVPIAFEFWAQPASNPRGYSWYFHNLAKYDRGISPVDRLLKLGIEAGRALEIGHHNVGLLADLRAR